MLEPGGRFCVAVVHPLNSAGRFEGDRADSPFTIDGSYLDRSYYADSVARDGLEVEFVSAHRPLEAYSEALAEAGLVIERLREHRHAEESRGPAPAGCRQRIPLFLHLRARKP